MHTLAVPQSQIAALDVEPKLRRVLAIGREHINDIEAAGGPPEHLAERYDLAKNEIEQQESVLGIGGNDSGSLGVLFLPAAAALIGWLFTAKGAVVVLGSVAGYMVLRNTARIAEKIGVVGEGVVQQVGNAISAGTWALASVGVFLLIERFYLRRSPQQWGGTELVRYQGY